MFDAAVKEKDHSSAAVEELLGRIGVLLTDLRNLTDLVSRINNRTAANVVSVPGRDNQILFKIKTTAEVIGRETAGWRGILDSLHKHDDQS